MDAKGDRKEAGGAVRGHRKWSARCSYLNKKESGRGVTEERESWPGTRGLALTAAITSRKPPLISGIHCFHFPW